MKCRVCGQPPMGPDSLCGDCARALKRAREGSAAVRNAPVPDPRRVRGVNKIMLSAPILTAPLAVPPGRRLALWGALAVSAIILAVTATRGVESGLASVTKVADRAPRPAVVQMIEPEADANTDGSGPGWSSTPAKGSDLSARVASTPASSPSPMPTRTARAPATAMSGSGAQSSAQGSAMDADKSASTNGQGSETAMQLARANVPASASSGDDTQALSSALERCGEEKFLAGVICEQKARLRFCEGKWGQVPQCTPKAKVD
ncbi:MAG: hypothetical protein ABI724_12235 [Betaproteobacteria bacterium]